MRKLEIFLLLVIIVGSIAVRLYRFENPILDWHSWRQADTSSVSRNFVKSGFDILHPKFDDLSNVPSGKNNPQGYRFVEFPIYNIAQAGLYNLLGIFTIEQWGRLVTIFSSVLSSVFIYLIVKKYHSRLAGILASFFFSFIPFNIYYSRTILPDISMVMAVLGGIWFFDQWISKNKFSILNFQFVLSLLFISFAFLLKPYALFFTLPMIYLAWQRFRFDLFKNWQLWIFLILSVIPLTLWRIWMTQYPQGIPASDWLFNGGNIRFKGAFFYWVFADRVSRLILGYWGITLFALGLLAKMKRENFIFFLSFLLSSLLYIFVIARGNVQHDYYQILILPTICIFLGIGSEFILRGSRHFFNRFASIAIFAISVIFMLSFGWYVVRDYFNINNPSLVVAGQAVDRLTPKDAKVIAIYGGDTSFLYQTNRQGWTSFQNDLPEMIKMGADYLVFVNPTLEEIRFGEGYKTLSKAQEYIIFDLNEKQ